MSHPDPTPWFSSLGAPLGTHAKELLTSCYQADQSCTNFVATTEAQVDRMEPCALCGVEPFADPAVCSITDFDDPEAFAEFDEVDDLR